jgi:hypothetical protein
MIVSVRETKREKGVGLEDGNSQEHLLLALRLLFYSRQRILPGSMVSCLSSWMPF